ncbi:MAG: NAD(P)H-binding protein [Hyphomicrobiales bacterium]|nr:NAD(P)H-binding protein [Hyphomicrobiales bacterium]
MRAVLVFGASRGVGLALARLLRRLHVPVSAMLRSTTAGADLERIGVQIVRGDAFSRADIARAFATEPGTCDVVSTLGGRTPDGRFVDDEGNINVIEAAAAHGVGRLVLVTSIGCGDMAPFRSERAIAAFGAAVDAKTRAEEHLRRVIPAATIIRPGGLRSDPATGRGVLTRDPQTHGFINREDVAELIVRVLGDPATFGQTFAAVDADMTRTGQ